MPKAESFFKLTEETFRVIRRHEPTLSNRQARDHLNCGALSNLVEMAKELAGENVALAKGYAKFLTHGMIHMDAEDIYEMIEAHSESYSLEHLKGDICAGPGNSVSVERLAK